MTHTPTVPKALNESAFVRWLVLLLVGFTLGTNYYFYDAISPLKDLLTKNLGYSSSDYGFFISAYSFPNVFLLMAVIGGVILDKIGIRITGFAFVGFMVIGAALTAYGSSEYFNNGGFGYHIMNSFLTNYSPALKTMSLGFFIFGLGAETTGVVVSKVIVKWFKGKELALALGLNVAFGRLGTAAALMISPKLVFPDWNKGIWFAAILLMIGLLVFLVYIMFDLRFDRATRKSEEKASPEDEFRLTDITRLLVNPSFIYITLLCVTFYSAVFPFIKYAPDMMINKFGMSRELAGTITALIPFGNILFTPIFGWIADNKGKSATLMILGASLLILVHLTFAFTTINPIYPMIVLGISFSLVPAAMWPGVAKIVDERKIGTAYGLMFTIQNVGLFLLPLLIGMVLDSSNKYATQTVDGTKVDNMITSNFTFNGVYMDNDQKAIPNTEINVNVTAKINDDAGAPLWDELHHVTTGQNGEYTLELGKGQELTYANIKYLNTPDTLYTMVIDAPHGKSSYEMSRSLIDVQKTNEFTVKAANIAGAPISETLMEVEIMLLNTRTSEVIWKEKISSYANKDSDLKIEIGSGSIHFANPAYFQWQADKVAVNMSTPLNYTPPIIMLVFLGVLGLFFAFMLKRDDKTSGYGLELPNKRS